MILAVDTSTKSFSVALAEHGRVLGEVYFDIGMKHSGIIHKYIDILLREAGRKPSEIKKIACAVGPGSFTGIRMGLCACRTMSQVLGVPLAGLPTLDVIAAQYAAGGGRRAICPVIKSTQEEAYTAMYLSSDKKPGYERITDYLSVKPSELFEKGGELYIEHAGKRRGLTMSGAEFLFVCDSAEFCGSFKENRGYLFIHACPRASVLAVLADGLPGRKYNQVQPLYITPPRIKNIKNP